VPEFSQAVVALQNGKFTTAPVKTQFGFHVILREDSKKLTPPPLDAVKDQFRPMMQRQKAQKFVEGLRTAAKVEILLPKEAAPATPAAAPAATEATQPAAESAPAPAAQ
jgi:peptidyl-prolyl cis-trans isomerase C